MAGVEVAGVEVAGVGGGHRPGQIDDRSLAAPLGLSSRTNFKYRLKKEKRSEKKIAHMKCCLIAVHSRLLYSKQSCTEQLWWNCPAQDCMSRL